MSVDKKGFLCRRPKPLTSTFRTLRENFVTIDDERDLAASHNEQDGALSVVQVPPPLQQVQHQEAAGGATSEGEVGQ